ncbi:MAG: recombinase family protein [Clostridiaceae bacterium]|nr:recombinase family protein [Clostridiaceae bacterium]
MARKSRKPVESGQVFDTPSQTKMFSTGLYVRISVENEQKIESDTIGTQIQMLKDFVSQMPGLKIYDIYCDDDVTGTTFIRPEFSRMMNDIRDGKVNCIVVKDLSRLGRNFLESGEYIEKVFPFLGVRFISINDRIDTLSKPADISAQIKNMANEMYAKDISRKICSTMRTLQEQGKFIGSQPPYGYMRNPDDKYSLLIDPETAPYVREMFQKILDGYTVHRIALMFNEKGIPSPGRYKYDKGLVKNDKFKNSVWFFSTMRRMLSDPVYLGWIESGKYVSHFHKGGGKSVKVPKEDWIVIKGVHEPIIEENVFWQVQDLIAEHGKVSANAGRYNAKGNRENILRGRLRCGECGKSMALCKKRSHEKDQMWYICPMHEHYNSSYCKKKGIKKEFLEQLVLTLIQNQMQLFVDAEQLIQQLNRQSSAKSKYEIYQMQIRTTEKQISRYTELKANLYQDYAEKLLTESDYMIASQEYGEKIDELKIFMADLVKESQKFATEYSGSEKWRNLIKTYGEQDKLSRDMVEAVIDKITAYNDGRIEIQFKNYDELEAVLYQAAERRRESRRYAG